MRPLSDFCCQNNDCDLWGKRNAGNLAQRGWASKKKTIRLLYCRHCRTLFSERKGTVLEGSRLPEEKAIAVLEHLAENNGVRQTARLVHVMPRAVSRLLRKAGPHAQALHQERVALSPPDAGSPTRRKMELRRTKGKERRRPPG